MNKERGCNAIGVTDTVSDFRSERQMYRSVPALAVPAMPNQRMRSLY